MVDPEAASARISIGFWIESPRGAQWTNQGMTRLVGFIIEGAAIGRRYMFRVCVTDEIRDEAEADLATLAATPGVDFTIHSPRDADMSADTFDQLAEFANEYVPVEAWISIFPNQSSARFLAAPVSAIFPDAIGLDYHDFSDAAWSQVGHHTQWRKNVAALLPHFDTIITFSDHVARDQVERHFGVDPRAIRVVPHAPPTLDGLLPFVRRGRRTDESRFLAAELLRRHSAARGWGYLATFPFEEVAYVAVSTQDRVTKNLRIVADAIHALLRGRSRDFKALVTAQIHFGTHWTPFPGAIAGAQLEFDVVSMPDLPRDVHAAFYHCAELTIHPSVFEGGRGVFPYYESISVGTPCLMANGPHVAEFIADVPDMAPFVFDPNDAERLADLIERVSADRAAQTALQSRVYKRLQRRSWDVVADEYARAALHGAQDRTAR